MSRKRKSRRARRGLLSRILRNRYNPGSKWVTFGDVIENVKETWFAFTRRIPPGSRIIRGRDGRIRSVTSSWNGPF